MKDIISRLREGMHSRPGIIGIENYRVSSVLIPIFEFAGEYHLIFEKRSKFIPQASEVCFPGGKHDPVLDSSFQDTALRETCEELSICEGQVEVLGYLGSFITPMAILVKTYVAYIRNYHPTDFRPSPEEVERAFHLPISFFMKNKPSKYSARVEISSNYIDNEGNKQILLPTKELNLPHRYEDTWGTSEYSILHYDTPYGPIWGITAALINELISLLE